MSWRSTTIAATTVLLAIAACSESKSDPDASGGAGGSGGSASGGSGGGPGGSSSGTGGGGGGAGGSAGSAGSGGSGGAVDACSSCSETQCASQWAACDASPDCTSLLDCLYACTDLACEDQCFSTHSAGAGALDAAGACEVAPCAADCGGGGDACDACVESKCAAPLDACLNDPACIAFWDCLDACTDESCANACVSQHPAGVAKSDAVDLCVDQQCQAECYGP